MRGKEDLLVAAGLRVGDGLRGKRGDSPGSGGKRMARTPRKMSVEHMVALRLALLVLVSYGTGEGNRRGWLVMRGGGRMKNQEWDDAVFSSSGSLLVVVLVVAVPVGNLPTWKPRRRLRTVMTQRLDTFTDWA